MNLQNNCFITENKEEETPSNMSPNTKRNYQMRILGIDREVSNRIKKQLVEIGNIRKDMNHTIMLAKQLKTNFESEVDGINKRIFLKNQLFQQ